MTSPNKLQVSELEHAEEFSESQYIHFTVLKKVETDTSAFWEKLNNKKLDNFEYMIQNINGLQNKYISSSNILTLAGW